MKEKIKKILTFLSRWELALAILLVGAGLFYWFQIRPSQIYSFCNHQAKEDAKKLLKTKVEMGDYIYKEAIEKGLYLKDDYEYLYKRCLRDKGINK